MPSRCSIIAGILLVISSSQVFTDDGLVTKPSHYTWILKW
jgi:hypothetical protein